MHISISDLCKTYPNGKHALSNINIEIGNGMIGLLGPNGAGKSTLMRILVTVMSPTSGKVLIDGKEISLQRGQVRKFLGYLPQDFRYFTKLRTWEFLDYAAALAGITNKKKRLIKVDEWLEKVSLFDVRDRNAGKLSGGMKRRLGIAQALIGDPKLIIVDEPTTGLDPEERIRFRNILSDLGAKDITIILSTHIVGDISSTCHDLVLLNNGLVQFKGSPEQLIEKTRGHVFKMEATPVEFEQMKSKYPVISTIPTENGWLVEFVADKVETKKAVKIDPNLEHAYVYFIEYVKNECDLQLSESHNNSSHASIS